jgi:hypothetical protein
VESVAAKCSSSTDIIGYNLPDENQSVVGFTINSFCQSRTGRLMIYLKDFGDYLKLVLELP